MVKKSMREAIFFIIVFLFYFLSVKLVNFLTGKHDTKADIIMIISAALFTLILVGFFYLAKLESNEGFWDVSEGARCKGGDFFYSGDSENARMCRQLASTPEGRANISGYNCPSGFVGQPGLPFYYSPLSDDNWENERCQDRPTCSPVDIGLCSFEKQIP